jgi:hypothetical protein
VRGAVDPRQCWRLTVIGCRPRLAWRTTGPSGGRKVTMDTPSGPLVRELLLGDDALEAAA